MRNNDLKVHHKGSFSMCPHHTPNLESAAGCSMAGFRRSFAAAGMNPLLTKKSI